MTNSISTLFKEMLLAFFAISSTQVFGGLPKGGSKLKKPNAAPSFSARDVYNSPIKLSNFAGKKVLLSFYRNVGCPVCNLRFHELEKESALFKGKGLVVLAVYESSAAHMQSYVENENFYTKLIPDSSLELYSLYKVEKSMGKVMKGMFHGAMTKMNMGKKLFKNKIDQDGSKSRIGADFLIDENGNILEAYYGKYLGDHLPVENIKSFLQ